MGALEGQIALVTGASRGIGAAVAKRLAKEGAQLILVARTKKKLEAVDDEIQEAGGKPATLVPLDLKDSPKIYELADEILKRHSKLDILFGNAGHLGELSPITHTSTKLYYEIMEVNCNANFHLVRAFDPLLQHSKSAKAIFNGSSVAQFGLPYWGAYSMSKSALEAMVNVYREESKKAGIMVDMYQPGIVATQMRALAFPGEDASNLKSTDEAAEEFFQKYFT